jgi:hypothetical protein
VTRPNICGKSTCATVGRNRLRVDLSVGLCLAAPVASLLALWDVKPNWTTTDRPPDLLGAHRLGVAANVLNNHILNCGAVANRDSHDWRVDECRNSRSASVFSFLWLYRGLQSLRLPISALGSQSDTSAERRNGAQDTMPKQSTPKPKVVDRQGTCAGGRVMSGMTSVVIVALAGAPAKTR